MSKTKKKLIEETSEETNRHPRYTVRKKLGKEKDILTDRQTDRLQKDRSQTGHRQVDAVWGNGSMFSCNIFVAIFVDLVIYLCRYVYLYHQSEQPGLFTCGL